MTLLLSASEIAALKLPGLPGSKVAIAARAEREGWYGEERTGLGGIRRVYRLPEHYLPRADAEHVREAGHSIDGAPVHRSVAPPPQIDLETLQLVETVLDQVLQERNLRLKPERRGAVVAFLYDYASKGGGRDGMLMALQALVA